MKVHGRLAWSLALLAPLLALLTCRAAPPAGSSAGAAAMATSTARVAAAEEPAVERGPLVLFLGDSLTAGYGLGEEEGFPALVGEELGRRGLGVRVVNAGVSGDTSAGGLARVDWLLEQRPAIVVVGLGANDGLRGLSVAATEENLRAIVRRCRASGAAVLLLGMRIPPNYGADYTEAFASLYPRLARELEVPLVPFLLSGVAARPELNLADGIHPNADGQRIVAGTVLSHLEPLVRDRAAR